MTRISKAILQAGVFASAVGLLPAVALGGSGADSNDAATAGLVDHATLEARGGGAVTATSATAEIAAPDHQTAEARGSAPPSGVSTTDVPASVPDHAEAEARGATGHIR